MSASDQDDEEYKPPKKQTKRAPRGTYPVRPKKLLLKDDLTLHKAMLKESLKEIEAYEVSAIQKKQDKKIALEKFCFNEEESKFSGKLARAYSYFQLLSATRKALECRDFPTLYELIKKGLEQKYHFLQTQMSNYFLIAIMSDPAMENKSQIINDFLERVVLVKTETEKDKYLEELFVLYAHHKKTNRRDKNDDDIDLAELSDVSVDEELLNDIRSQFR